jgi:hypothetical protein
MRAQDFDRPLRGVEGREFAPSSKGNFRVMADRHKLDVCNLLGTGSRRQHEPKGPVDQHNLCQRTS